MSGITIKKIFFSKKESNRWIKRGRRRGGEALLQGRNSERENEGENLIVVEMKNLIGTQPTKVER